MATVILRPGLYGQIKWGDACDVTGIVPAQGKVQIIIFIQFLPKYCVLQKN